MKTKIFPILFCTLLCLGVLYLNSCKPNEQSPCQTTNNTNTDFTAAELAKVPYNGFDTLYFLSKTGDTNIVVGGGKQYYYDIEHTTVPPDCPPNQTIQHQAYKINFTPIKGNLSFTLRQRQINYEISIAKSNYTNSFSLYYPSLGIKDVNNKYYFDSLLLNNCKYGRVIKMFGDINYKSDTTFQILINQSNGLLLIASQKDDEEYSIIKK